MAIIPRSFKPRGYSPRAPFPALPMCYNRAAMDFADLPRRGEGQIGSEIRFFPEIGSTNDYLFSLDSPQNGLVAVTDLQTSGRGRGTHRWDADAGQGLLFSFTLLMDAGSALLPLLPLFVALAVCEGVDTEEVGAKWPNDIVYGGKKLCGILIETRLRGTAARVVAGIGMNCNQASFPHELERSATSLRLIRGEAVDRVRLLAALLDRLNYHLQRADGGEIIELYRQRCTTIGRRVRFEAHSRSHYGLAVGLDRAGRLLIDEDGRTTPFVGSEVSHLRVVP